MLGLSYNPSERCYLEAAKVTFTAKDDKDLCQKIDVRYSYGHVSAVEYRNYYDPEFWLVRKVSWILSVPFRLVASIAALMTAAVDARRGDRISTKINLFSAARLVEYAAGDLICIFNDQRGQHWTTEAYVHIKLYLLALQTLDLRKRAFDDWFRSPAEVFGEAAKKVNDAIPPWLKYVMSLPKEAPSPKKSSLS